jgi:hypothetical protein
VIIPLSETTNNAGGQPKILGGQPNFYIRNTMNKSQNLVRGQPTISGLFRSLGMHTYHMGILLGIVAEQDLHIFNDWLLDSD